MKLEKAIRILTGIRKALTDEEHAALNLGIEALKQIKEAQACHLILSEAQLPSQTED